MRKLLAVHDSFYVPGRGRVIVGRIEDKDAQLLVGQVFVLVLSSGEPHSLKALGVEAFTGCFSNPTQLGILVGDQLGTSASLSDSEIWVES
ncbi:hypothetical protein [uncultured Xanthomonas sp.]|uniref:hypothetical protein n=1 Tax=uncultured Xanthomonas sp. TaxID=152831 RepID=UPI0025E32EA2|nr:hypothetical protein [uncultured Xanthomonas sp.]